MKANKPCFKKNQTVTNMSLFELNNENGKSLFLFGEKVY